MKTIAHTATLLLIAANFLSGCCKYPTQPSSDNTTLKAVWWNLAHSKWLISQRMADSLVWETKYALMKAAGPADSILGAGPLLEENIWQYIFSTKGLTISSGDTWHLHKAYDQAAAKVCFVLEVVSKKGNVSYYSGAADCPRICGYGGGAMNDMTANYYLARPLTPLADKATADAYMQNVQPGLVHDITIGWAQGVGYCHSYKAMLVQVVQQYSAMGNVEEPLFFNIDRYGNVLGGVFRIPMAQVCIAAAPDDCALQ
jgi:hypothetical protein